jgi:hypothetical protein
VIVGLWQANSTEEIILTFDQNLIEWIFNTISADFLKRHLHENKKVLASTGKYI